MPSDQTLSRKQLAIAPVAAATAVGDLPRLNAALNSALDDGLAVSEAKEVFVQLYAYAGFPRSLNALGELMPAATRVHAALAQVPDPTNR